MERKLKLDYNAAFVSRAFFSLLAAAAVAAAADFANYLDVNPEEWLEGSVVSLMNYGAFVRLPGGVDGMVHVSQMGPQGQRIDSVYDTVQVRVTACLHAVRFCPLSIFLEALTCACYL